MNLGDGGDSTAQEAGVSHAVRVRAFQGDFELEELSPDGSLCRVVLGGGGTVIGSTQQVVSASTGLDLHDPWVSEVTKALARERRWRAEGFGIGRRYVLEVRLGSGDMFHVSAVANRDSIEQHGLDWRRMGVAPGVAGGHTPELPGIFLQESEDAHFIVEMAPFATDVWKVSVEGLWVESGPSGWWLCCQRFPPHRLDLLSPTVLAEDPIDGSW